MNDFMFPKYVWHDFSLVLMGGGDPYLFICENNRKCNKITHFVDLLAFLWKIGRQSEKDR